MCHHPPSFQAQSAWPALIVKGVPGVMGNYGNTSCDARGPGAPAMDLWNAGLITLKSNCPPAAALDQLLKYSLPYPYSL